MSVSVARTPAAALPQADTRAKHLGTLLDGMVRYRRKWDEKWNTWVEVLMGRQAFDDKDDHQSNNVVNLMFSEVFSIIPFIAGRKPNIQMKARNQQWEPQASEFSQLITRAMDDSSILDRNNEFVFNQCLYGPGIWKFRYDPTTNGGNGAPVVETVPAPGFFLQPGKQLLSDCLYCAEVVRMDKLSLLAQFPDARAKIDALFRRSATTAQPALDALATSDFAPEAGYGHTVTAPGAATSGNEVPFIYDVASRMADEKPWVEVVEFHFIDPSVMAAAEKIIATGQEGRTKVDLGMPIGHVVAMSGGYVLKEWDERYPVFPYHYQPNYYVDQRPYSTSDVAQAWDLQKMINEGHNLIFDATRRSISRSLLYDVSSQLDPDLMTGEMDEKVPVGSISGVLPLPNPQVPAALFNYPRVLQTLQEKIMGLEEPLRGEVPGDVRSGYAVEQLQQAAAVRMRTKTQSLESATLAAAKWFTRCMADPELYPPGIHTDIDLTGFGPHNFDYEIKAGINLRASSASDQQFYLTLFKLGIVNEEWLVRHTDIPDKEALMNEMKPTWDARQAALAQRGGSPGAGGPTPG